VLGADACRIVEREAERNRFSEDFGWAMRKRHPATGLLLLLLLLVPDDRVDDVVQHFRFAVGEAEVRRASARAAAHRSLGGAR
jgi:hypothetical protein